MVKNEYIGVDLHIHTPKSSCYKGNKDDSEYIEIIKKCVAEDVKVVAITDHNSIKGYKQFLSIKEDLLTKIKVLNELSSEVKGAKSKSKELKNTLNLFNKLLLLPGIEVTVYPNIHMLVIFNPAHRIEEIEKFLLDIGYNEELQGSEELSSSPSINVKQLFELANKYDAIVIAPHVDSSCGIFDTLEGIPREEVFSSDCLIGITCNNPIQAQKIKNLILNQPGYKRVRPLAFLQASDSHKVDEIGSKKSFILMKEMNYSGLREALLNPETYVSEIDKPEFLSIVKNIIEGGKYSAFEKVIDAKIEDISMAVCAHLNNGFGHILLGISENPILSLTGISIDSENIESLLNTILGLIESSKNQLKDITYIFEKIGSGRFVIIVTVKNAYNHLFYMKNDKMAFIFDKGVRQATVPDIEAVVEKNMLRQLSILEKSNLHAFETLISTANAVKEPLKQFLLFNKIENQAIPLNFMFDITHVRKSPKAFIDKITDEIENGADDGSCFYIIDTVPRLKDAYLRSLCPRIAAPEEEDLYHSEGIAIVIADGGACHIIDSEEKWFFVSHTADSIILKLKDEYKELFSEYSILGWLKSSLFMWYNLIKYEDVNIYNFEIFQNAIIPVADIFEPDGQIDKLVKEMLELEYSFLKCYRNLNCGGDNCPCEYYDNIHEHNSYVNDIALKIDQRIIESIGIEEDEWGVITNAIKTRKIYNYLDLKEIE